MAKQYFDRFGGSETSYGSDPQKEVLSSPLNGFTFCLSVGNEDACSKNTSLKFTTEISTPGSWLSRVLPAERSNQNTQAFESGHPSAHTHTHTHTRLPSWGCLQCQYLPAAKRNPLLQRPRLAPASEKCRSLKRFPSTGNSTSPWFWWVFGCTWPISCRNSWFLWRR